MPNRVQLALLRISPSWGCAPLPVCTVILVQLGQQCRVETNVQRGRTRKCWQIAVSPGEVAEQFQLLKKATVPAFPISPQVCDGEYVELTIKGELSELTLGWWTIAPEGAEVLSDFAAWLKEKGLAGENASDD